MRVYSSKRVINAIKAQAKRLENGDPESFDLYRHYQNSMIPRGATVGEGITGFRKRGEAFH